MFSPTFLSICLFAIGLLCVHFLLNLWYSQNNQHIKSYAVADHGLGAGILVMSLVATYFESGDLEGMQYSYLMGIVHHTHLIFMSLMGIFLGYFVLPKLIQFKKHYTIAGIMEELYGPVGKYVTLVVASFACTMIILGQLNLLYGYSKAIFAFHSKQTHWSAFLFTITISLAVASHTALGGIKGLAATHVLQFLIIAIGLIVLASQCLLDNKTQLLSCFMGKEKAAYGHYLMLVSHPQFKAEIIRGLFWGFLPTIMISPPMIQHVLMANSRRYIRQMYIGMVLLVSIFAALASLVGFSFIGTLLPTKKFFFQKLFLPYLCEKNWLFWLYFLIVLATTTSTIASFLHATALSWIYDLFRPLNLFKDPSPKKLMRSIQYFTLFLGLFITILFAFFLHFYNDLMLTWGNTLAVMALSLLSIPFLLGVWGFKGNQSTFAGSFFGALIFAVIAKSMVWKSNSFKHYFNHLLPAQMTHSLLFYQLRILWLGLILFALLSHLLTHYIVFKGFVIVDRDKDRLRIKNRFQLKRNHFSFLLHPLVWADKKCSFLKREPYVLALSVIYGYGITYLTTLIYYDVPNLSLLMIFRVIGIFGCILLLLESAWPAFLRPYFSFLYLYTIAFSLSFVQIMTLFLAPKAPYTLPHLMLSLLLLALLVDRQLFIIFLISSFAGCYFLYYYVLYYYYPTTLAVKEFLTLFFSLLGSSGLAFFLLSKKTTSQILFSNSSSSLYKLQELQLLVELDCQQQLLRTLHSRNKLMRELHHSLIALQQHNHEAATKQEVVRIEHAVAAFSQLGQKAVEYLPILPQRIKVKGLINRLAEALEQSGIDTEERIHVRLHQSGNEFIGDSDYLEKLLYNSLLYLLKHQPEEELLLVISDTQLDYRLRYLEKDHKVFTFSAYHIAVTPLNQPIATENFYTQRGEWSRYNPLPLHENTRIIQAHCGYMDVNLKNQAQNYVLPLDLRIVRSNIQHFADQKILDTTVLNNKEDTLLLKKVKKSCSNCNQEKITVAIKLAKHHYHLQLKEKTNTHLRYPTALAMLVLDYSNDENTIIAALLCDAIEHSSYTLHEITATFGEQVANIVRQVSNMYSWDAPNKIKLKKRRELNSMLAKADTDALLIKLLDHLYKMRNLQHYSPIEKRKTIAIETKKFFLPIAKKLGLIIMAKELQKRIKEALKERHSAFP